MTQTDTEEGETSGHNIRSKIDRINTGLRVAGAIRQKHSIGLVAEHGLGIGLGRQNSHRTPAIDQHAQNVALYAKIQSNNMEFSIGSRLMTLLQRPASLLPDKGIFGCDYLREVHALEPTKAPSLRQRLLLGDRAAGNNASTLRTFVSQNSGQFPGIDIRDSHRILISKVSIQSLLAAPVTVYQRQVADH